MFKLKFKWCLGLILIFFLFTLTACSEHKHNESENIKDSPTTKQDAAITQLNITVMNSLNQDIQGLYLNTGHETYNQELKIEKNQQFQTAFPYSKDISKKITISYKDASQKEHQMVFPESTWYDHDSLLYVVNITGIDDQGVYAYTFYNNEEEFKQDTNNKGD